MILAQLHDGRLLELTGVFIRPKQSPTMHQVLDYAGSWWIPETFIKCIWRSKN